MWDGLARGIRDVRRRIAADRLPHLERSLLVSLMLIAHPASANAGSSAGLSSPLTLRRFELLDQFAGSFESSELNAYLAAVADSLELANSFLASGGRERLFCSDVSLDTATLRQILRDRITFLSKIGQDIETMKARSRITTVILQSLRERYPCR